MALHGATPQQTFEGRTRGREALFAYDSEQLALILSKTLSPGFGVLGAGTVLAENLSSASTGNKGKLVPYILDDSTETNTVKQMGVSFLVQDYNTGESVCYVTLDDSYRYAVGDDLILGRNNGGSWEVHNGGAITAIDRTTYPHQAKITFTTSVASANYTVANKAACWPEAATTTDKYSKAKYILISSVDTGTGEGCKGALAPVVISNAILRKDIILNYDSQAATDLSATTDGPYLILK